LVSRAILPAENHATAIPPKSENCGKNPVRIDFQAEPKGFCASARADHFRHERKGEKLAGRAAEFAAPPAITAGMEK
jgi:hypothetical protein